MKSPKPNWLGWKYSKTLLCLHGIKASVTHVLFMASSSSSASTVNTSTLPSPITLTTIHHLITIKITRDNYLLWKAQIVPYLKAPFRKRKWNGMEMNEKNYFRIFFPSFVWEFYWKEWKAHSLVWEFKYEGMEWVGGNTHSSLFP